MNRIVLLFTAIWIVAFCCQCAPDKRASEGPSSHYQQEPYSFRTSSTTGLTAPRNEGQNWAYMRFIDQEVLSQTDLEGMVDQLLSDSPVPSLPNETRSMVWYKIAAAFSEFRQWSDDSSFLLIWSRIAVVDLENPNWTPGFISFLVQCLRLTWLQESPPPLLETPIQPWWEDLRKWWSRLPRGVTHSAILLDLVGTLPSHLPLGSQVWTDEILRWLCPPSDLACLSLRWSPLRQSSALTFWDEIP